MEMKENLELGERNLKNHYMFASSLIFRIGEVLPNLGCVEFFQETFLSNPVDFLGICVFALCTLCSEGF